MLGGWIESGSTFTPWITGQTMLAQSTQAGAVGSEVTWTQMGAVAIALAVLIVPFIIGNMFARSVKMPNYGVRFGWILFAIVASVMILSRTLPGLGVDLRGGTIC